MSILSKVKSIILPKPFVDLKKPPLYISLEINEHNQIVSFTIRMNGKEALIPVEGNDIEAAWKKMESFVNKNLK